MKSLSFMAGELCLNRCAAQRKACQNRRAPGGSMGHQSRCNHALALAFVVGVLGACTDAAELTAEERATLATFSAPAPGGEARGARMQRVGDAYELAKRFGAAGRVDGFKAILETGDVVLVNRYVGEFRLKSLPPEMEALMVRYWDQPKMDMWFAALAGRATYHSVAVFDRLARDIANSPDDYYAPDAIVNTDLPDLGPRLAKVLPKVAPGRSQKLLSALQRAGTREAYQAVTERLAWAAKQPPSPALDEEIKTCSRILGQAPADMHIDFTAVRKADGVRPMPESVAQLAQSRPGKELRAVAMSGDEALIRSLKSAGVDPAAEMKKNPEYLFAALQSEATVQGLAYVLKCGADPNARTDNALRTPALFEARFDAEKIALLLAHGADPNVVHSSYTLLANVLFSHNRVFKVTPRRDSGLPERSFDKLALVQLLLDKGANVNGNNGGRGEAGALLLVRAEEPDVIDLLVKRGATLNGAQVRGFITPATEEERAQVAEWQTLGPVSVAVAYEREDLALALLRRDGKVNARDGRALAKAARMGFSTLALELVRLGADVNVADRDGTTPYGAAERRRDTAVLAALKAAGAKPVSGPARAPTGVVAAVGKRKVDSFAALAAEQFDQVLLSDPPRLYFGEANREHEPPVLAFYGDSLDQMQTLSCEEAVSFRIYYQANQTSGVTLGRCRKDAARLRKIAEGAKPAMDRAAAQLTKEAGMDPKLVEKFGLRYETSAGPGGSQVYSFAIMAVGHGLFIVPTTIVMSPRGDQAVVVQGELSRFCGRGPRSPICEDPARALTRLAQAVYEGGR